MSILNVRFLTLDTECGSTYLLGYPLRLSPSERLALSHLMTESALAAAELSSLCGISRAALSSKICSINKKARCVSGRELILSDKGVYRLNRYM